MKQSNFFQVVLLILFGFVGIVAVLIFGGFLPGYRTNTNNVNQNVVMWGTFPAASMQNFLGKFNKKYEGSFSVNYVAKNQAEFEEDLIEALAAGTGPDLVIMPQELLVKHLNKILQIPYTTISARNFQDTFFDGAEILLGNNGIIALPLTVDPLVMFYNKNLFSSTNLALPPSNWTEFLKVQKALTIKNEAGNLLQYGTALGEATNISKAKEILAALFIQAGDKIIDLDTTGLKVVLGNNSEKLSVAPATAALQFFTQFSDSNKATYSWNRSLPEASEAFLGGLLGTYFGFGSEIESISQKNPHLYFDIAMIPQRDNSSTKATYGRIMTVAVTSATKKSAVAASVAQALVIAEADKTLAEIANQAPARRDLLSVGNSDPKKAVIYKSALISRAWFDPNPDKSRSIFSDMIETITMGRVGASNAINVAAVELKTLIPSFANGTE